MFRTLMDKARVIAAAGTTYSPVLDLTAIGGNDVEIHLKVTARSGTTPTLQVIPQYSYDGSDWFDIPSTTDFSLVDNNTSLPSSETIKMIFTGQYIRMKYVVTGTTPSFTFDLLANASVGGGGVASLDAQGNQRVLVQSPTNNPVSVEVSVGTTPTLLCSADGTRRLVWLTNGAVDITTGDSNVTAGSTPNVKANQPIFLDNFGGALYGITAAGTSIVRVFTY